MAEHECLQEERITRIEASVAGVKELIAAQNVDIAVIKEKIGGIGELNTILRGEKNEPGLVAAVHSLTEFLEQEKDDRKWLWRLVVGAAITGVFAVLFTIFR